MVAISQAQTLPINYYDTAEKPRWLHDSYTSYRDDRDVDYRLYGADGITAELLLEIKHLTIQFLANEAYASPQEALSVLSHLSTILQRLLSSPLPTRTEEQFLPSVAESCRFAAALQIFAPLSGFYPDPTLMVTSMVHKLKDALTSMIHVVGTQNKLLLWLLAVGGVSARKMPEHHWFVGHMVVVIQELRITSWEEMRQQLMEVTWHDKFCKQSFHTFWEDTKLKAEALALRY